MFMCNKSFVYWIAKLQMLLVVFALITSAWSWSYGDRMKLEDIEVLTLYSGRMTASRRTSPVAQLQCVGGTAGCGAFVPQVVQCYNKGSDGHSIQWECKADMDNAYRFGRIEVVCEGYDHPGDNYILRGSCGLEYTLDLTKEGINNQRKEHNYYGGDYSYGYGGKSSKSFGASDLIVLIVICIVIYALYRTCIANRQWSTTNGDYPDPYGGSGSDHYRASAPPPPGFRPEYHSDSGAGCGQQQPHGRGGSSSGAGGFWTGAATGGLLGYMFGNRNTGYNSGYHAGHNAGFGGYRPTSGWGGGFSNSSSGGGGGGGGSSGSTGTRTASGFGGTRTR